MRHHEDRLLLLRPWSPRFLGQGVPGTPLLGDARPATHQRHRKPGRPQGEHRVEKSLVGQHPNFGRPAEFGESHEVGDPQPRRNTGLGRFGGSEKCQGFTVTRPVRDKGLRRNCWFDQCQGFAFAVHVRHQGPWKSGLPCKPYKLTRFAAVEHKSLRRSGRYVAMERDHVPRPFGHRSQRSSNGRLQRLLHRSRGFEVGMDRGSHSGWLPLALRVPQWKHRWVDLPLSSFVVVQHHRNSIEHHRRGAAHKVHGMLVASLWSCSLQLDWEFARGRKSFGPSPAFVRFIFQQCHQRDLFTQECSGCDVQRKSIYQLWKNCPEEGRPEFDVIGPSECHLCWPMGHWTSFRLNILVIWAFEHSLFEPWSFPDRAL